MSASTVNLILWAPFGAVCLLCGVFFVLSGYKRGLWQALLSLGATLVSAGVSMLGAKLLAGILAAPLMRLLPQVLGSAGALVKALAEGAVTIVASMLLFGLLFVILTPICKKLVKFFFGFLRTKSLVFRLGGVAVRAVDAVLFAALLLVPIYGTLATYLPVAQSVVQLQPESEQVQEYLNVAQTHPAVKLSQTGPAKWVYGSLSQTTGQDEAVNTTQMATSIQELMELAEAFDQAKEQGKDAATAAKDLLTYVRDDLLQQEWCAKLIEAAGKQDTADGADAPLQDALDGLGITGENFQEEGTALLDDAIKALERGDWNGQTQEGFSITDLLTGLNIFGTKEQTQAAATEK